MCGLGNGPLPACNRHPFHQPLLVLPVARAFDAARDNIGGCPAVRAYLSGPAVSTRASSVLGLPWSAGAQAPPHHCRAQAFPGGHTRPPVLYGPPEWPATSAIRAAGGHTAGACACTAPVSPTDAALSPHAHTARPIKLSHPTYRRPSYHTARSPEPPNLSCLLLTTSAWPMGQAARTPLLGPCPALCMQEYGAAPRHTRGARATRVGAPSPQAPGPLYSH